MYNTIAQDSDEVTTTSKTQDNTPTWWLDEKTPGQGNRPDWLPEKYKSVQDLGKAYSELEKRLGVAPQQYDLKEGERWIDSDYVPLQEMLDYAKSKHVPQDVMDKMLSSVGKYLDEFKHDGKEEIAKLGDNAKERLEVLNNWAKANFSDNSYNALTENLITADAIIALEEIRNKMLENNTNIPTGREDTSTPKLSIQAVQQELNDNIQKYKNDPLYREEITKKFAQVADQSDYVDKRY